MEDILKTVKSLEDSGLLKTSETMKDDAKEETRGLLSVLLDTLGASLLGNMLAGKEVMRAGDETARAGYESKRSSLKDLRFLKKSLIPPHHLRNFEI